MSRTKLLGYIGYLSLAKSKAGASFGSNRPAKTVDDSGEGQVEPGLSTSAGRSSSSRASRVGCTRALADPDAYDRGAIYNGGTTPKSDVLGKGEKRHLSGCSACD